MKKLCGIFLTILVLASNAVAQDVLFRTGGLTVPQISELQLHDEKFSHVPYTLEVPQITAFPQTSSSVMNDSVSSARGRESTVRYYYYGLVSRPNDYNFSRHYTLSNDYASAMLASWDGGGAFASGSMNAFPGMGNIATGAVAVMQNLGNITLMGALTGEKYHFDNRLYNTYGVSGMLSYRLSDRLTLNAFGSYYRSNGLYHSMASMPYLARSSYGATMGLQVSDNFSVEMGAQRYYDPYSHKWMTVPILVPQIDINGSKFGLDVGGILYQILHSLLSDYNNNRRYGPTNGVGDAPSKVNQSFLRRASSRR